MAKIFSDDIKFDPCQDELKTPSGDGFKFQFPSAEALPKNGYRDSDAAYVAPPTDRRNVEIKISPDSERLQRLGPFEPWDGNDFHDNVILIKTKGKCTTDHITPAGPWFRYRGHLENISNNTLIGAVNSENGQVNAITNQLTKENAQEVPATARYYQEHQQPWVVIADHNYGEGSSREHAALQPRYLGGKAIIAKSFARIHESNLKKQGMLALTFADEADYDRIDPSDRISIKGLKDLSPGNPLTLTVEGKSGSWDASLNHTFSEEQIGYFHAGSALNLMAQG